MSEPPPYPESKSKDIAPSPALPPPKSDYPPPPADYASPNKEPNVVVQQAPPPEIIIDQQQPAVVTTPVIVGALFMPIGPYPFHITCPRCRVNCTTYVVFEVAFFEVL